MINLNGVNKIVSNHETISRTRSPKPPTPPTTPPPAQSPIIDHFPLDKNLAHLMTNKFFCSGTLPELPPERKKFLVEFLNKKRTLRLQGASKTIILDLAIAELLKFSLGKNKLVGGFVKYILGSQWFLKLAQLLKLPDTESVYFKKIIEQFDKDTIDIDLQHINSEVLSPDVLYIKLLQYFAELTLPKQASNEEKDHVYKDLALGYSKKIKNPWVTADKDTITVNVMRMPIPFEGTNQIDLTFGTVCQKAYVATNQDFFISLDNLDDRMFPQGEMLNGWKAAVDCLCNVYNLEKIDVMSWTRAMLYNTHMGRHPFPINRGIYLSLDERCESRGKVEALTFLATEILKHRSSPDALLVITYNICADLRKREFPLSDLKTFCQRMLREEKYTGLQRTIQQALMNLPFDVLSSCMELIGILKLASRNNGGLYLTQHDGVPSLMTFIGDCTCLQSLNPILAIKRLQDYSFSREGLEILDQLFADCEIKGDLKRDFESAIDTYQHLLRWNWEQLTLETLTLFNKSKELDLIAQKFYFLCTGTSFVPQGKSLYLFLHIMRTWNPLDRLDGKRLWQLYTQSLNMTEIATLASDMLEQSVHPKLALYVIDNLIKTSITNEHLKMLLTYLPRCGIERTPEDLRAAIATLKNYKLRDSRSCQVFLENWICNAATSPLDVLQHATNEQLLDKEEESSTSLWMRALQITCEKKEYAEALQLWKNGDDFCIWKFQYFQKSQRRFVIEFIEHLYSLQDPDCDAEGHNLLERLEVIKDKLSAKHTQLIATRDSKLPALEQSNAAIKAGIASFEKAVKDSNTSQNEELKGIANGLFDRLAIRHAVHRINEDNLETSKRLLSNPKVVALYSPKDYQQQLTRCIVRANRMAFSGKTDLPVVGFLLELYFKSCSNLELSNNVLDILIAYLKREERNGLRLEIRGNIESILNHLKTHDKVLEVIRLLQWFINDGKSVPNLAMSFWVMTRAFEQQNRSSCLHAALDYFNILTEKHPIPIDYETTQQFQLYTRMATYYIETDVQKAQPWIKRSLTLATTTNIKREPAIDISMLEWCKDSPEDSLISTFLEMLFNSREDLKDSIWKTTNQLRDSVIMRNPRLYMRILKHVDLKSVSDCTVVRIVQVIQQVLPLKENQEENLDIALRCCDIGVFFYELPFNSLLKTACEINNASLKAKALALQVVRVAILFKLEDMRHDRNKMKDWTASLELMFRLINQLKTTDQPFDSERINMTMLNLLFNSEFKVKNGSTVQEHSSSSDSPLKFVWNTYRFKEIPEITRQLFNSYFELLPTVENNVERYLGIISGICEAIEKHAMILQGAENDLIIELIKILSVSTHAEAYLEGLVLLENLFKKEQPRIDVLVDIFAVFLINLVGFKNNNKILNAMNSAVMTVGTKVNENRLTRLYPALVKIFPDVAFPGRYLLPVEVLAEHSNYYYCEYILKSLFLEKPVGFLSVAVAVIIYVKGISKINMQDTLLLIFFAALYYTYLYPRYGKKPEKNPLIN